MQFDSSPARSRLVSYLGLLPLLQLMYFSIARAQEGVTGAPPVFSSTKKTRPSAEEPVAHDMPKPPSPSEEGVARIRVMSNLVTAPVTVLDSSGEFVYDLEEKDFQIIDNGVPQRIEGFETETRRLAAAIVIQVSDSVTPLLDQVRRLGPVFSDLMLGPNGQAAVVLFDDKIRVAQDFSNAGQQLGLTLSKVVGGGGKGRLNDALSRAVAMLEKRPKAERRVIIAFSDGFDSGSETDKDEVVRRATAAEVSIYGLRFNPAEALLEKKPQAPPQSPLDTNVTRPLPPGVPPTPTNSENTYGTPIPIVPIMVATGEIIRSTLASSTLEYYAGYTGGVFYSHWSKKALEEQLTKIASEINSQYELAYVPDTLAQPGFHRIEVQVRRPGVKVRTRAGYFHQGKSGDTPPSHP